MSATRPGLTSDAIDGPGGSSDGDIADDAPRGTAKTPEDFARFEEKPRLKDLMEYVGSDLKAKWEAIAVGLGIEQPQINGNHQGAPDASHDCMRDVFDEWKRTMVSEYSWKKLAAVLYSNAVGEKDRLTDLYTKLSKQFSD